ncbi:DUF1214 domain-containing protein [Pseudahrensia aquimaris]|uniref:DUF1214 domain-containing protein n=1 Tax=Pseudahrensia aquimaris TaxID=744461 RepID=A0ABW3FDL7_9HYPH
MASSSRSENLFNPMRLFVDIAVIMVAGLVLGGLLSKLSIENNLGFGALKIGQWTAWPQAGSRDADPYTKAKVAADGEVPLGAAEGIAFHGRTDETGEPLNLKCSYLLQGSTPNARLWTLAAHRNDGSAVGNGLGNAASLVSRNIVRDQSGRFSITVGPQLAAGNWLQTSGDGPFELVFRLYDSPVTASGGIVDPEMPIIRLMGCQQ